MPSRRARYSRVGTRKVKKKYRQRGGNLNGNVYIFYHIYCNHNTVSVVSSQCMRIIFSGLYEKLNTVYCFLTGHEKEIAAVENLLSTFGDKFKVAAKGPGDTSYERFTLHKIHEHVQDTDKFLYIHSKGVSDINHFSKKEAKKDHIYWWRTWMEYFLIGKFQHCLDQLNTHDIVGINYSEDHIGPHFSGNFWWSTGRYYKKLSPTVPVSSDSKLHYNDPEKYIFSGNPKYYDTDAGRIKKLSNGAFTGGLLYTKMIYPREYVD